MHSDAARLDGLAHHFVGLPFAVLRDRLYTVDELYASRGDGDTLDAAVFAWDERRRHHGSDLPDTIAARVHDACIDEALEAHLRGRRVAAVMGGHRLRRDSASYREVAHAARLLCADQGTAVLSGGGPGAMEAANLGARCAPLGDRGGAALDALIASFDVPEFAAPTRSDEGAWTGGNAVDWLADASAVRARLDALLVSERRDADRHGAGAGDRHRHGEAQSVAIPTWFYGHEPTNVFAGAVAKYFANSIREDGLLGVATAGVLYAEGGPGTLQEVFQDAAQNAYATFGAPSPMVFLDVDGAWTGDPVRAAVLGALRAAAGSSAWAELVTVVSSGAEAAAVIAAPIAVPRPAR